MAPYQHATNLRSDTVPIVFKNDDNNVAALENARLQKKRMEEAARLQQQQLDEAAAKLRKQVEDTGEVVKERNQLRSETERLNQENTAVKGQIDALKRQKDEEIAATRRQKDEEIEAVRRQKDSELDSERSRLNSQIANLSNSDAQRAAEITRLNQMISIGDSKWAPNMARLDNCLPLMYHNATVHIVNLYSQLAIDSGNQDRTRVHGWQYDVGNTNQIFKLARVSNDTTPDGYWTITRADDNQKLYYPNNSTGLDVHVGSAPGKQDYWYIGRGSNSRVGSWVIKNAEWGTYIEFAGGSRENGRRICSYAFSDHADANWVIIPSALS